METFSALLAICAGSYAVIDYDNGLSPVNRKSIIWTNGGLSLIWLSGINFSKISIKIKTFSFKKLYLKMLSAK